MGGWGDTQNGINIVKGAAVLVLNSTVSGVHFLNKWSYTRVFEMNIAAVKYEAISSSFFLIKCRFFGGFRVDKSETSPLGLSLRVNRFFSQAFEIHAYPVGSQILEPRVISPAIRRFVRLEHFYGDYSTRFLFGLIKVNGVLIKE